MDLARRVRSQELPLPVIMPGMSVRERSDVLQLLMNKYADKTAKTAKISCAGRMGDETLEQVFISDADLVENKLNCSDDETDAHHIDGEIQEGEDPASQGAGHVGGKAVTTLTIPTSVTVTGTDAFCGYMFLVTLEISKSVTHIGDGAFKGCCSLRNLTIPNSVTGIGIDAFKGCRSLATLTIPKSVNRIEKGAFWKCPWRN
ncbi:Putative surface protein bspA-like (TvBspA-like-625) [Durusdinium trenchii]|uniref:Surface protein bspA-like (TvBspA-like-625) n=1 Tax=Durusdinium trenchii TaxID=1381693 RepID=A0ABP0N055_9DINO